MSTTSAHTLTVVRERIQRPKRTRIWFPAQKNIVTIIGRFYEQPMDPDRYQNTKLVERARELFNTR